MIVNGGLGVISDAEKGTVDKMKAGDDDTATSAGMTDLVSAQFTDNSPVNKDGNLAAKAVHTMRMSTAQGNGVTFKEVGTFAGSVMIARKTHADVVKTASFELLYEVTMEVQNA